MKGLCETAKLDNAWHPGLTSRTRSFPTPKPGGDAARNEE